MLLICYNTYHNSDVNQDNPGLREMPCRRRVRRSAPNLRTNTQARIARRPRPAARRRPDLSPSRALASAPRGGAPLPRQWPGAPTSIDVSVAPGPPCTLVSFPDLDDFSRTFRGRGTVAAPFFGGSPGSSAASDPRSRRDGQGGRRSVPSPAAPSAPRMPPLRRAPACPPAEIRLTFPDSGAKTRPISRQARRQLVMVRVQCGPSRAPKRSADHATGKPRP